MKTNGLSICCNEKLTIIPVFELRPHIQNVLTKQTWRRLTQRGLGRCLHLMWSECLRQVKTRSELFLACQAPMGTDMPDGEWGDEWMVMMTRKTYEVCLPYLSTNKTINVLCCVWGDSAPSIGRLQDGFVASTAYRYTSSPAHSIQLLRIKKRVFC